MRKKKKKSTFKEKLEMYDMILANLIAGKSIIEPSVHLDNSQICLGFSNVSSATSLTKLFMISRFPDWLEDNLIRNIRNSCIRPGLKINFFIWGSPYRIAWESPEMKSRMRIFKQYSEEISDEYDYFQYRNERDDKLAKRRIMLTTKYLNEADLEHRRSLIKATFIIKIVANRDDDSLVNMAACIEDLNKYCLSKGLQIRELRTNMYEWVRAFSPFCMDYDKQLESKICKKILTDDILASMDCYEQGKIGKTGVVLGVDVDTHSMVMRKFKADPDGADNWLISATTGGGKSYFVKSLLTYLLADNFVVSVMDYEGDEYTNLGNFIKAGNPKDVQVVSMGKGSTVYFDPCPLPELTGVDEVDNELKSSAMNYILAIFRIIAVGINGTLTQWEEKIISLAIQRMYSKAGVTDDKSTFKYSKGLLLRDVYSEICYMAETKEFADADNDNVKHKAAVKIAEAASVYFEPGEAKADTFKNPMSASELYAAKLIIFSFGMKGAGNSVNDPTILALKQLSVSYVNIQISNYCKYIRKCFNVKVWEEFQRWGEAQGSAEIISNAITGGRKRGDVNFIITNDLSSMLDFNNKLTQTLSQNIQNYAIGAIDSEEVRKKFCKERGLMELEPALTSIARMSLKSHADNGDNSYNSSQGKYRHAFCVVLDNGKRAIVKSLLPPALAESDLFKTGVKAQKETPRSRLKKDM